MHGDGTTGLKSEFLAVGTYPFLGVESKQAPVNKSAIYEIPRGCTVEPHVVIKEDIIGKCLPKGGQTRYIESEADVDKLFVRFVSRDFFSVSAQREP